jgi:hypothetical protein
MDGEEVFGFPFAIVGALTIEAENWRAVVACRRPKAVDVGLRPPSLPYAALFRRGRK